MESLEQLLRFGALMLRAGDAAFRVRGFMSTLARGLRFDELSVQFGLASIAASGRRDGEVATLLREVEPSVVDAGRITALERLVHTLPPAPALPAIEEKLAAIERAPPRYSVAQTAAAVGAACGAFAFLNGGVAPGVAAAAAGGAAGQALRASLHRRRLNQHAIALICAVVASGVYCLIAAVVVRAGHGAVGNSVGLICSALFLLPGFHLLAAPLDLLQHQAGFALSRLAEAVTQLLAAALGLSAAIAIVRLSLAAPPALAIPESLMLALRALASFVGACGFAILYNSAWRNVVCVGVIAIVANEIRLGLHEIGWALPPATFVGALVAGLMASLFGRWFDEPRITLAVPALIMMVPGLYAFETVVYLKQGAILDGLQAAVLVGFVFAAMSMGLAAANALTAPRRHGEQPHA